jgi:hypothetical protein
MYVIHNFSLPSLLRIAPFSVASAFTEGELAGERVPEIEWYSRSFLIFFVQ